MTFYGPPSPSDYVRGVITSPLANWGRDLGIPEPDPGRYLVTLIRFFSQEDNSPALASAATTARTNLAEFDSQLVRSACAGSSYLEPLLVPPPAQAAQDVRQDLVACLRFLRVCAIKEQSDYSQLR